MKSVSFEPEGMGGLQAMPSIDEAFQHSIALKLAATNAEVIL